jgi:hypothetical protein
MPLILIVIHILIVAQKHVVFSQLFMANVVLLMEVSFVRLKNVFLLFSFIQVNLHMSSYCSPLKKSGQTCSLYHSGETRSTFSCPCSKEFKCASGGSFQIHPLINIHKNSVCKSA